MKNVRKIAIGCIIAVTLIGCNESDNMSNNNLNNGTITEEQAKNNQEINENELEEFENEDETNVDNELEDIEELESLEDMNEADNELKNSEDIKENELETNELENNDMEDIKGIELENNNETDRDTENKNTEMNNEDINNNTEQDMSNNINDKEDNNIVDLANVKNDTDYEYKVTIDEANSNELMVKVELNNTKDKFSQVIDYKPNFNKTWYDMYTENNGEIVRFFDINFDGNDDIILQVNGAFVNQSYLYYLYDSEKGNFVLSDIKELGELINPKVNVENKLFLSTSYNRGIPNYEILEMNEGNFKLVASIKGDMSDDDNVIYEESIYAELDKNNKIIYKVDPEVFIANNKSEVEKFSKLWTDNFELDFPF